MQLLQQAARDAVGKTLVRQTLEADDAGTHFTCFTGTKVRILTQAATLGERTLLQATSATKVQILTQLLVQKCTY